MCIGCFIGIGWHTEAVVIIPAAQPVGLGLMGEGVAAEGFHCGDGIHPVGLSAGVSPYYHAMVEYGKRGVLIDVAHELSALHVRYQGNFLSAAERTVLVYYHFV
jgi:hypothetical protein